MSRGLRTPLRWFLFVVGIGCLMAAGIYLGRGLADGASTWRILRCVMFTLLGVFFLLMYGENRDRPRRSEDSPGQSKE